MNWTNFEIIQFLIFFSWTRIDSFPLNEDSIFIHPPYHAKEFLMFLHYKKGVRLWNSQSEPPYKL